MMEQSHYTWDWYMDSESLHVERIVFSMPQAYAQICFCALPWDIRTPSITTNEALPDHSNMDQKHPGVPT